MSNPLNLAATAAGLAESRLAHALEGGAALGGRLQRLGAGIEQNLADAAGLLQGGADAALLRGLDALGQQAAARASNALAGAVDRLGALGSQLQQRAAQAPGIQALSQRIGQGIQQLQGAQSAAQPQLNTALASPLPPMQPVGLKPLSPPPLIATAQSKSGAAWLLSLSTARGVVYQFGLATAAFDKLIRTTEYRVAQQDRLERAPASQAVGKGGDTITLSGAIFCHSPAGAGQLNRLRALAGPVDPFTLSVGNGQVLGQYYLIKITEEQAYLLADGTPRQQSFTLEFQRYGPDNV